MNVSDLHPLNVVAPWAQEGALAALALLLTGCAMYAVVSGFPKTQTATDDDVSDAAGPSRATWRFRPLRWLPLVAAAALLVAFLCTKNYSPQSAKDAFRTAVTDKYGITVDASTVNRFVSETAQPGRTEPLDALVTTPEGVEVEATLATHDGYVFVLDATTGIELPTTGDDR